MTAAQPAASARRRPAACTSHAAWDRIVQTTGSWPTSRRPSAASSEAGLRPVYHRKPERVRGHLFIAVLAYHAIHLLLRRPSKRGAFTPAGRRGAGCLGRRGCKPRTPGSRRARTRDRARRRRRCGGAGPVHRRRVRIPAREVGQASGPLFGDPPSAGEKNPVVT